MNKENILNDVYYDIDTGLRGRRKLYEYLKIKYPQSNITYKEIDGFLARQEPDQILKPVQKSKLNYNTTITKKIGEIQVDIMDMNYFKNYNRGYRYILIIIDTYSRRIFLRAIKDKTGGNVLKGFITIEDEYKGIGEKISNIVCDEGSEFKNNLFLNHFKDIKDNIFFKNPEKGYNGALAIVDRVIRTIRDMFRKAFTLKGNYDWIDIMYKIERNYNDSFHSSLKDTPNNIFYGKHKKMEEHINVFEKLKIGDRVRVLENINGFNKKHLNIWSKNIYEIEEIDGVGYKLSGLKRKYFDKELQKIDDNTIENNRNNLDNEKLKKKNTLSNRLQKINKELK